MRVLPATAAVLLGSSHAMDLQTALSVTEGIITGAVEVEVPDLSKCVDSLDTVGFALMTAINDFKEETWDGAKDGVEVIGKSVVSIYDLVKDCKAVGGDFSRLAEIGEDFSNPWSFTYHVGKDLIVNGVQIYDDIKAAVSDYDNHLYYDMGVQIGKSVALAALGSNDAWVMPEDDSKAFKLTHSFFSVPKHFRYAGPIQMEEEAFMNPNHLYSTIHGLGSQLVKDIDGAISKVEIESKSEALKILHDIGSAYSNFVKAHCQKPMTKCTSFELNLGPECLKAIEDTKIDKETVDELQDAIYSWILGSHENAGRHFGKLAYEHCFKKPASSLF